ncbi:NADH-quinone oxidoreductase subunit NuoF [Desulfitibacter alkalitolerans]|uniref:NADH-quinone oxidoreductase subunit NuoF n=1 Tax=Desulfitibacter alkalitolerans TaxID=264641 RepID=UPI00054E2211|nr:NADH-quinone oxidoreductase subunit NuoF [Desulfitibacter alkalitolerans]
MQLFRAHVLVCSGTGCHSFGSKSIMEAFKEELDKRGLGREVKVVETGCSGLCALGPNVIVYPEAVLYCTVKPEDVPELVEEHFVKGRILKRLTYQEVSAQVMQPDFGSIDFFKRQKRIALRNCGVIDPESIKEYIARDGYFGLAEAVTRMEPSQVLEEIKKSGLRGRGGGGFPTGLKWEFAARAEGTPKYVVCNADEGDPGAFMDRSILEGDPHSVVEGMAIAGYAIGASKGYLYVRAEYPIAVKRLKIAIDQAKELKLLGNNIFGTDFSFDLEIRLGAGAFVCGEETALIASIEGRRGEPRTRPPFPAASGLWGKPTIINNVETLANVATIIRNGWEWFAEIGTEKSKGTKVFALAGKIKNNGLVEVPMGTKLGEVIFDIGGGIPEGKRFKAAQTGGPSGGCIPAEHLNVPIDYESLTNLGTIMGSGGLIIMDEDTCMVDLAKFFVDFVKDESCGKCTPCRIGSTRMLEILDRITKGQGQEGDIELLLELGKEINESALCGLGQTAPNPVISTIRYFRHEYEAHIKDKYCEASVCATMFNSPCQNTCPAGIDIPIYVDLIAQQKYREAYEVMRNDNPLSVICGRVCHHPCEGRCNRSKLDDSIAIRDLKRFATDALMPEGLPVPEAAESNGKKVAIVGSGPAGLTAAYYLRKAGYEVTIFEALPVAGGMLRVGIPDYRLPADILQAEIKVIEDMGVEIKTGVAVGRDIKLSELKEAYSAVFLAVGAHKDQNMGVPGEHLKGVVSGVELLRDLNLGSGPDMKGKKIAVIGGGNVAMDVARSAIRKGAEEVHVIYRRTREDMPAMNEEIEDAIKEGVKISYLASPTRIIGKGGKVSRLECVQSQLGDFDPSGRRKPVQVPGSTYTLDVDMIVPAIGQQVDDLYRDEKLVLETNPNGTIISDLKTCSTSLEGVFSGGDCVTGPNTVVAAIKAGKLAAISIDKYLNGKGVYAPLAPERKLSAPILEEVRMRVKMGSLEKEERLAGFGEVELGFTEEEALREAQRCMRCDIR